MSTETVETPAPSLRETLEASIEQIGTAEVPDKGPIAEIAEKTPVSKAEPTSTVTEVPDQKPSAQKPATPEGKTPPGVTETPVEGQEPVDEPVKGIDKAPQSWKPAEKAKWMSLDAGVRSEITRRERDTARSLQQASDARKFASGFEQVVKPHMDRWRAGGLTATRAVEGLIQADYVLSAAPANKKAEYMAKLINDYGIDIKMLDEALSGTLPAAAPNPEDLIAKVVQRYVAPLMTERQQREQQEADARQRNYEQQVELVEQSAQDPAMPFFEDLRNEMADIIEINLRRGKTVSLKQAYTLAVQMNPETAAEAQKLTKQSQAQQRDAATRKALGASLSVAGNPSTLRTNAPANDLRATIEAAVAAQSGR